MNFDADKKNISAHLVKGVFVVLLIALIFTWYWSTQRRDADLLGLVVPPAQQVELTAEQLLLKQQGSELDQLHMEQGVRATSTTKVQAKSLEALKKESIKSTLSTTQQLAELDALRSVVRN